MYFSRIRLRPSALNIRRTSALLANNQYVPHQLLWHLFPDDPDASRDFLFRHEEARGGGKYYLLSRRQPAADIPYLDVETKPYDPQIRQGDRLVFSLRANPVVRRDGKRHDVVMDEKQRLKSEGKTADEINLRQIVLSAGWNWLARRAEAGGFSASPESVRIEAYQQRGAQRPKSGKTVRFSTLDYDGILTVTDESRFGETLRRGLGPSKAFGCGLMLIQRG